ncbi:MAG: methyltransferase domain-containing protein [Phycisphaerales bacterium]|nr:methyltransferase domain-containing protein [Phycisphaerales bacterium]
MRRKRTPELMDDPGVDPAQLARSLAYIRAVNRRLGGRSALLGHLERWSKSWTGPVTLLDVATGSADLPVAACDWARRAGHELRVTGVDLHAGTRAEARRWTAGEPAITLVRGDALKLEEQFGPGSFDYVHAGLFLHHLDEADIERVMRGMWRVARRGVIWNDLVRSRAGLVVIHLLTIGRPRIIRHDARVSVRAGFTRGEAMELVERAGWPGAEYRWSVVAHRFTVTAEKT